MKRNRNSSKKGKKDASDRKLTRSEKAQYRNAITKDIYGTPSTKDNSKRVVITNYNKLDLKQKNIVKLSLLARERTGELDSNSKNQLSKGIRGY